ncbi:MAG: F0F1 ATP synthase subunit B [Planctomycetaceae bacterium]
MMFRYVAYSLKLCCFAFALCVASSVVSVYAQEHAEKSEHGGEAASVDGHAEAGGHGTAPGPPMDPKADLALWSLVVFVIFLFVLKKLAWKPMIEGLDRREAGIRSAIAEAEENQRKSQALLADYEAKLRGAEQTVADMVAEAKRDAERVSQDIVAKAQADVEAMRVRAKEDIGRAKDAALADVFTSVNRQVAAATERVLGRAMNDADQDRLISEALQEIGT